MPLYDVFKISETKTTADYIDTVIAADFQDASEMVAKEHDWEIETLMAIVAQGENAPKSITLTPSKSRSKS